MPGSHKANVTLGLTGIGMLLALVLLLGGLAYSQFAASTAQAQIEVHRKAHVVATQFSWVFQASAQALQRVEEAVAATSDSRTTQIRNISQAVRDLPAGYQHSVYDPQGRLRLFIRHGQPLDGLVNDIKLLLAGL